MKPDAPNRALCSQRARLLVALKTGLLKVWNTKHVSPDPAHLNLTITLSQILWWIICNFNYSVIEYYSQQSRDDSSYIHQRLSSSPYWGCVYTLNVCDSCQQSCQIRLTVSHSFLYNFLNLLHFVMMLTLKASGFKCSAALVHLLACQY